jgi:putative endonuclease
MAEFGSGARAGPMTQNPVYTCARSRAAQRAHDRGLASEAAAESALRQDGWNILGRRLRTRSGEIDIVAEKDGLLAFLEVKARPTLAGAAYALSPKQCARILSAAELLLADHPEWQPTGVRFDVLLVDQIGRVRRVVDAFRREEN